MQPQLVQNLPAIPQHRIASLLYSSEYTTPTSPFYRQLLIARANQTALTRLVDELDNSTDTTLETLLLRLAPENIDEKIMALYNQHYSIPRRHAQIILTRTSPNHLETFAFLNMPRLLNLRTQFNPAQISHLSDQILTTPSDIPRDTKILALETCNDPSSMVQLCMRFAPTMPELEAIAIRRSFTLPVNLINTQTLLDLLLATFPLPPLTTVRSIIQTSHLTISQEARTLLLSTLPLTREYPDWIKQLWPLSQYETALVTARLGPVNIVSTTQPSRVAKRKRSHSTQAIKTFTLDNPLSFYQLGKYCETVQSQSDSQLTTLKNIDNTPLLLHLLNFEQSVWPIIFDERLPTTYRINPSLLRIFVLTRITDMAALSVFVATCNNLSEYEQDIVMDKWAEHATTRADETQILINLPALHLTLDRPRVVHFFRQKATSAALVAYALEQTKKWSPSNIYDFIGMRAQTAPYILKQIGHPLSAQMQDSILMGIAANGITTKLCNEIKLPTQSACQIALLRCDNVIDVCRVWGQYFNTDHWWIALWRSDIEDVKEIYDMISLPTPELTRVAIMRSSPIERTEIIASQHSPSIEIITLAAKLWEIDDQ